MFKQRSFLIAAIVLMCCIATRPCSAVETGTLRVDGEGVQALVLFDGGGDRIHLDITEHTATLEVGGYTLREVHLTTLQACRVDKPITFTISADAETILKAGGPLTASIDVKRRGRALMMEYKLTGVEGGEYDPRGGGEAPRFAVFKGNRKVGEGRFEYG